MNKMSYSVCYEYTDNKNKIHTKVETINISTISEIYFKLESRYNKVKILSIIRN